jgi:hypothetical protein
MINCLVEVDKELLEFLRAKVEELKKVQLFNITSDDLLEKWISVLVEAQFIDSRLDMGFKKLNRIIDDQTEARVMKLIRARIDKIERKIKIHSSTRDELREYLKYKLSAVANARDLLAQDRFSKELRNSWLNAANEFKTIDKARTKETKTLEDLKKALSDNPSLIKDIEEFEKTLPNLVYSEATEELRKESEIVESSLLKRISELTILAQKWEEAENERLRQEAEEERRRQAIAAEEERRRQELLAAEERRRQEKLAEEERLRQEKLAEEERLRREEEEIRKIAFVYDEKLKDSKEIVIPEGLQYIRKKAFYDFRKLETVDIPSSITKIEDYAFYGCSSLKEIWIPDSVTEIGRGAFIYCDHLKTVRLPHGIKVINSYVFERCRSLESIVLPESVSFILSYAFKDCTSLKTIHLPDRLLDIGLHAFKGCSPFLVLDNLNDWVKRVSRHDWW